MAGGIADAEIEASIGLFRSLVREGRATVWSAVAAAGVFAWYALTDEVPTEFIPFFPHVATLLVLVFAAQRLRPPAADGRVFRRGGSG